MTLVDEIAFLLGEQAAPAESGREDMKMSWTMLITILFEVIKQRSDAGWPIISAWLEKFKVKVITDAQKHITVSGLADPVGDAPDSVKDALIAILKELQANANIFMKGIYALLLAIVPIVSDRIWDSLFAKNLVSSPLSSFTPLAMGAVPQTVDSMIEELAA